MQPEDWARVRALLEGALDEPRGQRARFVEQHCPDQFLRSEALRLLSELDAGSQFLESRPARLAGALLAEAESLPRFGPGDILAGRFRVRHLLGVGGMGEVYEAEDLETGAVVAIKTIRGGVLAPERTLARLREELILGRAVTHRNVCRIFDLHQHAGSPEIPQRLLLLSMELVEGETLASRLARKGPMPLAEAIELARQLAAGLAAAHEAGIIHGDLKPANVMLAPGPAGGFRAVLMDFGIAAAAGAQTSGSTPSPMGTPAYMASEQAHSPPTATSDVYSFGVVVYEALAGARPPADALAALPAGAPSWFAHALLRCLQPPDTRWSDGRILAAALNRPPRKRQRIPVAAAAAVAALLLAGLVYFRGRNVPGPVVAVLGFKNSSGINRASYLSLMLSLAFDADLASATHLRVLPAEDVARTKTDLRLPDSDRLTSEQLSRLRAVLGADLVLVGSYSAAEDPGPVRVDIAVQDARTGATIASEAQDGSEMDIPGLASRAAARIREQLRVTGSSGDGDERMRAVLPGSLEAMRLYADGLEQLRTHNTLLAKDYLEKAVAADPNYPQAHSSLSQAWADLGYDGRALEEARIAYNLRARLPDEDRLMVEAAYFEVTRDRPHAVAAYQELLRLHPDNPDYLLLLAGVQPSADAMRTIAAVRRMPPPVRDDPRIDLAEAEAADRADNYRLERVAARHAADKGLRVGALQLAANALVDEGFASWVLGDSGEAGRAYAQAKDLFTQAGDRNGVGAATRGLGLVAEFNGDLAGARLLYSDALNIFKSIGSQYYAATSLSGLAMVASSQGLLNKALDRYQEALEICKETRSPICLGRELNNEAYVLFRLGRLTESHSKLDQAWKAFEEGRGTYGESFVLASQGDLFAAEKKFDEAEKALRQALDISLKIGDRVSEGTTEVSLAAVMRARGDLHQASQFAERGLQQQIAASERDNAAKTRLLLSRIALDQNRAAAALSELKAAMPEFQRAGRKDEIAVAEAVLAEALALSHDARGAAGASARALQDLGHTENRLARVTAELSLGKAAAIAGETSRARELLTQTRNEASQIGFAAIAAEAEQSLGSLK